MRSMVLISNNPVYTGFAHPGLDAVLLLEGSSLDVLREARDKVHLGWRLLHHPLYGNIRPTLQPFRTMLLEAPSPASSDDVSRRVPAPVDPCSLDLITQAMNRYESEKDTLSYPWSVPASMKADCAFLDRELMRETLAQAGLPPLTHFPGKES